MQLATITGQMKPRVSPPGIIVFAADHGVAEEGVSAYPQEVTAQMVRNFLQGGAAINVFARQIGALLEVADVGVAQPLEASGLVSRKVRYGTANFLKEPAMSQEEAVAAIEAGIERAEALIKRGIKSLIVGEMGIGNTTASSAMLAAFLCGEKNQGQCRVGYGGDRTDPRSSRSGYRFGARKGEPQTVGHCPRPFTAPA